MPFSREFDQVMTIWAAIAAAVFAIVVGTLLTAIIVNRMKRRKDLPFHASKNTRLELAYVAMLAVMVAGLVTGSFLSNSALYDGVGIRPAKAAGDPEVGIDVIGYRWCWDFAYRSAPVKVTGDCRKRRYPTLVVPAGEPVDFALISRDVMHSFWLPDFAVKRDLWPDHVNHLRMVFPREGRWRGRCSEYCGTHHWTMDFYVRAVSPERYRQFLAGGGTSV